MRGKKSVVCTMTYINDSSARGNTCKQEMEDCGAVHNVMDSPDHFKFFELLLRPKSAHVNARFLESADARKLACVSKTMRRIVPAGELENNRRWKENGENVFGAVFTELCNICTQAGYNAATLPGFYMNVNEILSGNYLEEIRLDTIDPVSSSRMSHSVRNITDSMLGLKVGRSRGADLSCLSDPDVSKTQAIVHRHTGALVYRNMSMLVDSWKRSTGGSLFVIMPRTSKEGVRTDTVMQIGDYVVIATSNLSTLRVTLAAQDVERLLQLMHSTKSRDDRDHGPYTLDEAQCELELARARAHRQAHDDFFAQRAIYHRSVGQIAIDFAAQKSITNKDRLDTKVSEIDKDVQRLEAKLMRLQKHHNVLKHLGLDGGQARPAKRHAADPEIALLQAEITELKSTALMHAQIMREQNAQLQTNETAAQCAICFEKRISSFIFRPCAHVCCCEKCARIMVGKPCPLCRVPIQSASPVYM